MGIILAEEFKSSPLTDAFSGVDSLPCPPAKFHTPGNEASYIIVPLSELVRQDGAKSSSVTLFHTFAIDRDRVSDWQEAGHIQGIKSEDEIIPGTADIFASRAQAQSAVNMRNEAVLRNHYKEVHELRRTGVNVKCHIEDVSHRYDDLAVAEPVVPSAPRYSPFGFKRP
jgi:hypothetical protein